MSEHFKKVWEKHRDTLLKHAQAVKDSPEIKKRISEKQKRAWQNPKIRERRLRKLIKIRKTPEYRAKMSKIGRDPNVIAKKIQTAKKTFSQKGIVGFCSKSQYQLFLL